jgi:hypothetical protein
MGFILRFACHASSKKAFWAATREDTEVAWAERIDTLQPESERKELAGGRASERRDLMPAQLTGQVRSAVAVG